MSFFQNILNFRWHRPRFGEERRVEPEAFYQGAHDIPVEDGLAELQSFYEEKKAALNERSTQTRKRLEGELDHINQTADHSSKLWVAVRERVGDRIPGLVMPIVAGIVAAGAVISEGLLLAPTMDVLSVTEPVWQFITGLFIASVIAFSFHLAWESVMSEKFTRAPKIAVRTVAAMLAICLVIWGVFRGKAVAYAANLNDNPLGSFLSGHPFLAGCFYVFVSLGVPVIAAAAASFANHDLHMWWEWKRSKRGAESIAKLAARTRKQIEAEQETLKHSEKKLDEECKRHCAAYRVNHQRGKLRLAKQEPYWTVQVKAIGVALLFCPILFDGWELGVVPAIVYFVALVYFRRRWQSPTPKEYFDREKVRFADQENESDRKGGRE